VSFETLLPLVAVSGVVDGLHPCAFAVLLFFIAFLLSVEHKRKTILFMGIAFITGVFITYLLIGLGILKVFTLFTPHFVSKAGALLLILVGLIDLKDAFAGTNTLTIPKFASPHIHKTIEQATIPAALVAGLLVGLCAFPCVGGIYVAILGLLTAQATAAEGFVLLVTYNIMFVLPLVLVLLFASNETVIDKIERFQLKHKKTYKVTLGIAMILFGLFILFGGII